MKRLSLLLLKDKMKKNMNTYAVMDAVYAFAYALRDLHTAKCGNKDMNHCTKSLLQDGQDLMTYLKEVKFNGEGNYKHFESFILFNSKFIVSSRYL